MSNSNLIEPFKSNAVEVSRTVSSYIPIVATLGIILVLQPEKVSVLDFDVHLSDAAALLLALLAYFVVQSAFHLERMRLLANRMIEDGEHQQLHDASTFLETYPWFFTPYCRLHDKSFPYVRFMVSHTPFVLGYCLSGFLFGSGTYEDSIIAQSGFGGAVPYIVGGGFLVAHAYYRKKAATLFFLTYASKHQQMAKWYERTFWILLVCTTIALWILRSPVR